MASRQGKMQKLYVDQVTKTTRKPLLGSTATMIDCMSRWHRTLDSANFETLTERTWSTAGNTFGAFEDSMRNCIPRRPG